MTTTIVRRSERGGTTAELTAANEILLADEVCIEVNVAGKRLVKIGDGVTHWLDLPYLTANLTAPAHAADVIVTPGGALVSTDVQTALLELDSDLTAEAVARALKVDKSTLDAQSFLGAIVDDTPVAIAVGASSLLGRKATGNIGPLSVAESLALLAVYTSTQTDTAISTQINALVGGAPGLLDTLKELADALGDDPNFAATMTAALAAKAADNAVVKLTGDQSPDGIKKWLQRPVTQDSPFFHGANPNGTADCKAALLASDGDATSETWLPPGIYRIAGAAGDVVTFTKPFRHSPLAELKPDSGVIVNCPAPVGATGKIYDLSAGGFVNPKNFKLDPAWWGYVADGLIGSAGTNRAAMQAAVNAAGRGGIVQVTSQGFAYWDGVSGGGRRSNLTTSVSSGSVLHVDPTALVPPGQTLVAGDKLLVDANNYDLAEALTVQSVNVGAGTVTLTTPVNLIHASGVPVQGPGQKLWMQFLRDVQFGPASGTEMFHFDESANATGDRFDWDGGKVISTFNHPYTQPIINIGRTRSFWIHGIDADIQGTGVLLGFMSTYGGVLSDMSLQMRHNARAFDFDQDWAQQLDSVDIRNVIVYGPAGYFWRRAVLGADVHNVRHRNFKIALPGGVDFQTKVEAVMTANVAASSSSFTVRTGQGAAIAARVAAGQTYLIYDHGNRVEDNTITSVAGDVVNLMYPTRFDHTGDPADDSLACTVLMGGVGISLCPNMFTPDLAGVHFEGVAVAVQQSGVAGLRMSSTYHGVSELVRSYGACTETTWAGNCLAGPDIAAFSHVQYMHRYMPFGASTSAANFHGLEGNFLAPASAPLALDPTTGTLHYGVSSSRTQDSVTPVAGTNVRKHTRWTSTAEADSVTEESGASGSSLWRRTIRGAMNWGPVSEVSNYLKRTGANAMEFGGTVNFAGGAAMLVKAGVPADGDYPAPRDGLQGLDSTTGRIWTRIGGVWLPERSQTAAVTTNQVLAQSSSTMQNITQLALLVLANQVYSFELVVIANAATSVTPDLLLGFTFPGTIKYAVDGFQLAAAGGGAEAMRMRSIGNSAAGTAVGLGASGDHGLTIISGTLVVGVSAGTLQAQAAQNTPTAENVTIETGSKLTLIRV